MPNRFFGFISIGFIVLAFSYFYLGIRLIRPLKKSRLAKLILWGVLFSLILIQVLGHLSYRQVGWLGEVLHPFHLQWPAYGALGFWSCLFTVVILVDFLKVLKYLYLKVRVPSSKLQTHKRREFLKGGIYSVGVLSTGTLMTGVGIASAISDPTVKQVEIPLEGLPDAFRGFRIAQISDLHIGPTIKREYVERVVSITNELKADLIVVTGDMVDGKVLELSNEVEPLGRLQSPHGIYYVTGNHEYYWGAKEWIEKFKALGMVPLINEGVHIQRGDTQIYMGGVSDIGSRRFEGYGESDSFRAIEGAFDEEVKVLLAHQPRSCYGAKKAGFHFQISGHTHAGQTFPWSLLIYLFQPYVKGLNRHEGMWVYVNQGTGYWGPPLRLGVPSEITLFSLQRV